MSNFTPPFDVHVHSNASDCAHDMPFEYLAAEAGETGGRFALTDHSCHVFLGEKRAWALFGEGGPRAFDEERAAAPERFERYLASVQRGLNGAVPVGLELDVTYDGRIVLPDGYADRFWPVVGAVHWLISAERGQSERTIFEEFRRQTDWILDSRLPTILAHPFRMLAYHELSVSDALIEWVVSRALDHDVAVEINSHKQHFEIDVRTCAACVRAGVRLALATDSHEPAEFGDFSYHEKVLAAVRERGLDPNPLIIDLSEQAAEERT